MERWTMLGGMLLVHVAAAPNEKLFTPQHRADLWPWTVTGCSLSEASAPWTIGVDAGGRQAEKVPPLNVQKISQALA